MVLKYTENGRLDSIDKRILAVLAQDGRIAYTDLAQLVGLSKSPCQARVKRLQAQGFIKGFRAVLDPEMLNVNHIAFVEVKLNDTSEAALSAFNKAVSKVYEIEQCHMIAGAFDYLMKVRTSDIQTYRRILGETISALPHVANTSTHVCMETVKDEAF